MVVIRISAYDIAQTISCLKRSVHHCSNFPKCSKLVIEMSSKVEHSRFGFPPFSHNLCCCPHRAEAGLVKACFIPGTCGQRSIKGPLAGRRSGSKSPNKTQVWPSWVPQGPSDSNHARHSCTSVRKNVQVALASECVRLQIAP